MGHWVGQKTDPTAREQVDGKCRCVCYKGDVLQQLTPNRRGLSNQQAPACREDVTVWKLFCPQSCMSQHF